MCSLRFSAGLAAISLWSLVALSSQVRTPSNRTEVARGVTIVVPRGWVIVQPRINNSIELVRPSSGNGPGVMAHMAVFVEPRKDHAEALDRMVTIANQFGTVLPSQGEALPIRYFVLNGFPAIEKRYQVLMPRPAAPQQVKPENEPFDPTQRVSSRLEAVVAVNALIVRFQGDIPLPIPNPSPLPDVQAIEASLAATPPGNASRATKEINAIQQQSAQPPLGSTVAPGSPSPGAAPLPASPGAFAIPPSTLTTAPTAPIRTDRGELEVTSNDGNNVVIAANFSLSRSDNRGVTFTPSNFNLGFANNGDPSVAVGASNSFYVDVIGLPAGGCANSVARSDDNGANFNFVAHAVACPPVGVPTCFPDQEHLAADRVNSVGGQDQLYNVWRNFLRFGNCQNNLPGFTLALLTCSLDGGFNWPIRSMIGFGDFPRVTVGPDGFVYTVLNNGGAVEVNKFSSCATGLVPQLGFPRVPAFFNDVNCPVPGLDRCIGQNDLSSPTLVVDDINPNHLYLVHATNTFGGANEEIILNDSNDGGFTWSPDLHVNAAVPGRRFMPWVCSTGGVAWISWYDRRSVTAVNNSNTEFFLSSAAVRSGALQAGVEVSLSGGVPDQQCASAFACGTTTPANATSCQPALMTLPGPGGGCPKYGDYNGIGCAAGQVFSAWSSATPPAGVVAPGPGINIYTDARGGAFVPRPPPTPPAPGTVFTCDRVCPNLTQCYGIGEVNDEPGFCSPPNLATDTLLRVGPGAPVPQTMNTGATPVFRCVQPCPNLAFCYGKGQLTTSPQNCFPKMASPPPSVAADTNIRVFPGAPGPALPAGPNHVFRCENFCPNLKQCYGKGQYTINPEFCFPKGPVPRPSTVAFDTGLTAQ